MSIERISAQKIIARNSIELLSDIEVQDILSEYWLYENEQELRGDILSGEIPDLCDRAIKQIITSESPINSDRVLFKPLLLDMLVFELKKVKNSYLETKLAQFGHSDKVIGAIEESGACPCCFYYSIDAGEEGLWDICPVCFWENGGDGPNHISIGQARINFIRIGAIDERSIQFVDPEGKMKYEKRA